MSDRDGVRFRRIYSVELVEGAFRGLDNDERVVWLYCKASLQSTSVGIYRLSSAVASEDLGNVTADEFDQRFDVVCQACGWHYDPDVRVLWIPEWLEDNPPQSPNVVVSWRKLLNGVPDCAIKGAAVDAIHRYLKDLPESFRKAFGSYRVSLPEDIEISKALPKAKPKSNQGSGIRDQGSEIREQGSRRLAPRAVEKPKTTNGATVDGRMLNVAREALKFGNPNGPIDELIDTFHSCKRASGISDDIKRPDVIAILNIAIAEQRSAAS